MQGLTICPQCGSDLKARFINLESCQCGWLDPKAEVEARNKAEKRAIKFFAVSAVALLIGFGHALTWGGNSLKIPVLRLKQVTGTLGEEGYKELASVCFVAGKYECTENAFEQIYAKTKKADTLLTLAKFQLRQSKDKLASKTFARYFDAKGKDGQAMLAYAKLLENENRFPEAIKYYNLSIKTRKDVVPVQATAGIVRVYLKQKKVKEAYFKLVSFKNSSVTARDYLDKEMTKVKAMMRSGSRSIASQAN